MFLPFRVSMQMAMSLIGPTALFGATSYIIDTTGDTNPNGGGVQTSATSGDLRYVINAINYDSISTAGTYQVDFQLGSGSEIITLQGILPPINMFSANTLTIDGSNTTGSGTPITLDGNNAVRGLFISLAPATSGGVTLSDLTIQNCQNAAGSGSGGGAALGAGLFVREGAVTISNVDFIHNQAIGGDGAALGGGWVGGGGMGGNAGTDQSNPSLAGSGGGGYSGGGGIVTDPQSQSGSGGGGLADAGASTNTVGLSQGGGSGGGGALMGVATGGDNGNNGNNGGLFPLFGGGAGGTGASSGPPQGAGNGGDGGISGVAGSPGLNGGGGGGGGNASIGGAGGIGGGGGGGGAGVASGGAGGDFGGGGGSAGTGPCSGGNGGFGGGGGGSFDIGGNGGFGGGGGGGATPGNGGFGGGGGLTSSATPSVGGVGGGSNGGGGAALGGAIFVADTGSLQILGGCSVVSSLVTAGHGIASPTNDGAASARGICVMTGASFVFAPGAGETVTISDFIGDDSAMTLPSGGSYTPGTASGATLTMSGEGTLVLSAANSYAGLTSVTNGTLDLTGNIAADVSVTGNGVLTGTGDIGGTLSISGGGQFTPVDATSSFMTQNLTYGTGGIYQVAIDPSQASILHVGSTATLRGQVQVLPEVGTYSSGQYLIMDASSMTGAFNAQVLGTVSGFGLSLNQTGNNLYLVLSSRHPIPINDAITGALKGNELKIANYLNAYASSDTLDLFYSLSGTSLKSALDSVSPARNAFGPYITQQTAMTMVQLLASHMDSSRLMRDFYATSLGGMGQDETIGKLLVSLDCLIAEGDERMESPNSVSLPEKVDVSLWASGFVETAKQKASLQNPNFHYVSEGGLLGVDGQKGDKLNIGGALGYAHTTYHEGLNAGKGHINYYFGSLYGNVYVGNFYFSPAVWGVFNQIQNTRHIAFSGFVGDAKATFYAWQLIPHIEIGYDQTFSWGHLMPFIAGDWAITWQRAYSEHGSAGPFLLRQTAQRNSMVRSETGLKLAEIWHFGWGSFLLKEKVSYVYERPIGTGTVNSAFAGIPANFTVTAVNQALNLGAVGLDFIFAIGDEAPITMNMGYEGEFGKAYQSHEVMFTLKKAF